jgi:type II secretory pathway predicted ATPase ExeA
MPDFYRELGHLFAVPLAPHNRWAGFKSLRETWTAQIEATRCRPVLLIDEAQEILLNVLAELRILAEHAAGNLRVLANMAHDLLEAAARRGRERIDAQL